MKEMCIQQGLITRRLRKHKGSVRDKKTFVSLIACLNASNFLIQFFPTIIHHQSRNGNRQCHYDDVITFGVTASYNIFFVLL